MSPLILNIRLDTREAPSLGVLQRLSGQALELLDESIPREEYQRRGTLVSWVVRKVDVGSLSIAVEGRPVASRVEPGLVERACSQLVEDIGSFVQNPDAWLEMHAGRDSDVLEKLRNLGELALEQRGVIVFNYGNRKAIIGGAIVEKADNLLKAKFSDWGSVEGFMETVTVHHERYFRIYPVGQKIGARCNFPEEMLQQVREALAKRVAVWGQIFRSPVGTINKIDVKHLEILDSVVLDDIRPQEPLWPGETFERLHSWTWEE